MKIHRLSIVIPVYNEERSIVEILDRLTAVHLKNVALEIIIVDDGSTDNTRKILRNLKRSKKYHIIFHKQNLGKGAALRTGFAKVTGDAVIVQDADLEYNPQDIPKLIQKMEESNALVVYGSRMLGRKRIHHGGIAFFYGGRFINHLTNVLYRAKLTDEATGYKLFDAALLQTIPLSCKRFEFCPEVTAKIARRGIRIYEVAISYTGRTKLEGKKINISDGIEAIWTLIRYRF